MGTAAAALVGAGLSSRVYAKPEVAQQSPALSKPRVSDTVVLGKTGIKTSRVAIGTGTDGGQQQRNLGTEGLTRLLRYAHDEGVRWWDTADMYKTHSFHALALKEIKRDEVVITSKTRARDAAAVRADIERFRKEMNTDYIDIVLLHCIERTPNWRKKLRSCMDVLSEAKQKGWIRAHGCSCHDLAALKEAAEEPWVEVDLARFNPFAQIMDVGKKEELVEVEKTLARMHARGGAVYAMKVIGNGKFTGEQIDESLRFSLSKPYITAVNIGFTSPEQIDDIGRRFESIRVA
jgi:aryl-alcohol dehydrogenase-like predicted oxidoreductase